MPNNARLVLVAAWFVLNGRNLCATEPVQQIFLGVVSYNETFEDKPAPLRVAGATIRNTDPNEEILVEGRDHSGRPWRVRVKTAGGIGYSVAWHADLDDDAQQDLLFVHHDSRTGRCVDGSRLTTILFDSEGRPTPWEVEGYFLTDFSWDPPRGTGITDWADWNQNGGVELVQTDCYSYAYQSLPHGAYGLVDVYEARDGFWRRLTTTEREGLEQTYVEVAGREHRKLRPRPEEFGSFVPDHSNDRGGGKKAVITELIPRQEGLGEISLPPLVTGGRYIGVTKPTEEWKTRQRERNNDRFILDDGTSCYGKPAILIDRPEGIEATLEGSSGRAQSLLEEIVSNNLPVTLTGQTREGLCSPAMLWAEYP